jgi:serine/threonine-protein kinase HipA
VIPSASREVSAQGMPRPARKAAICFVASHAGILEERTGGYAFSYDPAWLANPFGRPISLAMPLRPEPFLSKTLHPFFENLLPEGWLLEIATQKLKISKDDAFGLLLATCADCIGAVEVLPLDRGGSTP